jgi:hypothetical protein
MSPTTTSPTTISPTMITGDPPATLRRLRPLVGSPVTLHTVWGTVHGMLLSCVKESAWLIAGDDTDLVVPLADVLAVRPS